jgi:FkbM family methyltransferase
VHAVSHRVSPPGRRVWAEVEAGAARGASLLVDPRYDAAFWRGDAEPELQEILPRLVRPGTVAWDVGAHIGFYTLLLSRCVGPDGRVVAFEPDDSSLGALRAAVERNRLGNVEIRSAAVWSHVGRVGFESHAGSPEGWHGAVREGAEGSVPATTLDLEAERGPAPDFVKIDVEGAEEHVLRGAGRLLTERRPVVLCEVHLVRRGGEELLARVTRLLLDAGYRAHDLTRDERSVHLLAEPLGANGSFMRQP